jgi:hypothetical protein
MAGHRTVDIRPSGNGQLGGLHELSRSNTESLKASFPNTPSFIQDEDRDDIKATFEAKVLNGTVSNGYLFSSFDRDYSGAPTFAEVSTGKEGLPGNPWQPNTASPAEGIDWTTIPDPPKDVKEATNTSTIPGSGEGGTLDPQSTSQKIRRSSVDDLTMGQSPGRPATWGSYSAPE